MNSWQVWTAGPPDAETLARLEALAFGGRSWGRDSVKESFVAPRVTVLFGGERETEPQGFAVWRDLGAEAELLTIGVIEAARSKGLGEALLTGVIEAARAAKAERCFLEVDAANKTALALYSRAGFAPIGARKRYYADGGDATVMALDL
ncbi:GNAT family N-acetyltransferase [Hyphococcus sp.]|jgi:ribosomal-protein-alanine N-acetyltransferase|uniref:GNAT family N-acetyltransferase n=1 Tax=Hyphococcus sp. TaxID=2038636 RepID=UPI003D09AA92